MQENTDENVLSLYEVIRDRDGRKHRVYSARFKDLQTITSFTERYNADGFGYYMLAPVLDEDGNVEHKSDGSINYDNGFLDDLFEIVELALDHRESREQIEAWLDIELARQIVVTFLGLSSFKKKRT
ncbi:MAG: hypothetical protein SPL62_07915 [Selenomonas sp.]|nr:hypothetical protein [Selenomonas sp.]